MKLGLVPRILIAAVVLLIGMLAVSRIHLTPNALSIEVLAPEQADLYQVFYDLGRGFNETDSISTTIQAGKLRATVHLFGFPALQITSFRINPGARPGTIRIASITLQHEFHRLRVRLPLHRWSGEQLIADFTPLHHFRDFTLTDEGLALTSTGNDPYFAYHGEWQIALDSAANTSFRFLLFLYGCCLLFAGAIYGILPIILPLIVLLFHPVVRLIRALVHALFSKLHEQVFINMLMACAMLLTYMLIASRFLPEGINAVFVSRAWKYVLVLMVSGFLMFPGFVYVLKVKTFSYSKTLEKFKAQDVMVLLLPITPIVQYLILNQDILNITDSIIIIIFFVALAFVTSCIVPWLLSTVGSRAVLMSAGLSLTYVLMNMSALASSFQWHLAGNLVIQSGIFIFTAALFFFLYSLEGVSVTHTINP